MTAFFTVAENVPALVALNEAIAVTELEQPDDGDVLPDVENTPVEEN